MRKVLLLTHEYYPYRGGVARYCYNLFRYFDSQDYLVITDHPDLQTRDNIQRMNLKFYWLWPTWLFTFFKLRKLIREQKLALIFTPNILPLGSLAYFINLVDRVPYVISLHGLDIRLALQHKPWLAKRILSKASLILTNSKNTKQVIEYLGLSADKIKVLYPGLEFNIQVDPAHLKGLRERYNIKADDKILLTVGRLNKRKGQDLVIKALAQLTEYKIKYFIIGSGEMKNELLRLIRYYNLADRVFILESISDEQKIYYYKLAEIFVLPNRHDDVDIEGFGLVFMEAAACQLAIIAGNSGGVAEIWENNKNAILIDNENIAQLSGALRRLWNNPALGSQLGQQAYARFKQFPTAREQSNKLKELFQQIV